MIVFDFDGVIGNSIYDSFLTALNTYIEIYPDSKDILAGPIEPASSVFDHVENYPEIFQQFNSLIPLGNHAEDYVVIFSAIVSNQLDLMQTQEAFYTFRDTISEKLRKDYGKRFYQIRHQMQYENSSEWVKLLPSFSEVVQGIRLLSEKKQLAIATAKDLQSVQLLLKEYELVDVFLPETIFDKETGASKKNHLTKIHERFDVPFNEIHFVDDKVSHLQSVSDLGVHSYLATWGFNTERERQLAKSLGFTLLKKNDLVRMPFI